MRGVRFITGVYLWIGWVTLVVGIIAVVVVLAQLFSQRGAMTWAGLLTIVPFLALALGPFTVWAFLRGILEVQAQGEQILRETRYLAKHATVAQPQSASLLSVDRGSTAARQEVRLLEYAWLKSEPRGGDENWLRSFDAQTKFTVLEERGDWLRLRAAGGHIGWIKRNVVEPA